MWFTSYYCHAKFLACLNIDDVHSMSERQRIFMWIEKWNAQMNGCWKLYNDWPAQGH